MNRLFIRNIICCWALCTAITLQAQKTAHTADGETYIINPNGTWKKISADSARVHETFSAQPTSALKENITPIVHHYYTIGYDAEHKLPAWTYYQLRRSQVDSALLERVGSFTADPKTNAGSQGDDNDYKGSSYDKGHMVPCEDMSFDALAMKETFYYSNCVPQTSKLNRGQWKNLEQLVRNWAIDNEAIEVFSGPVLTSSMPGLGSGQVAIPAECYKVILDHRQPGIKAIAFVMPNQAEALAEVQTYACSIDHVEALTGLDFFPELPDEQEKTIEASYDPSLWNWDIGHYKSRNGGTPVETRPEETPAGASHQGTSVQCSATTQKGSRCKHMTTSPNGKCSMHGGD